MADRYLGGSATFDESTGQYSQPPAPSGAPNVRDPAYVREQAIAALTRRNAAYGRPGPPTEDQINEAVNYVLTPDRYSDGQLRSGWSDYWANRFGVPGNEGAAGGDMGGAGTLLPDDGRLGGYASGGGGMGMGGGLMAPYSRTFAPPPDFQAPTADEVMNSPAVQARMRLGQDALQRSAAARGTLLTGGTLKDLNSYAQDVASQEYGNEWDRRFQANNNTYGRRFGEYGLDRDTFWGNQNNAFNKGLGFAQLGLQGASTLGQFGSQYGSNVGNAYTNIGNAYTNQGQANAGNTLANANNTNQLISDSTRNLADWATITNR